MSKKLQKSISIFTSVATILWLSGIATIIPIAAQTTIVDGDLIQNPSAAGAAAWDVYIAKIVGTSKYKRLVLSPHVFESYGHLSWSKIKKVDQATLDSYTTSDLVRGSETSLGFDDPKVYKLIADGDTGTRQHLNMTAAQFEAAGYKWDSIYIINQTDRDAYTVGTDITSGTTPPTESTGTLSASLAADTPAAGIAVGSAARMPFTKVNLTASGGDVIVDSMIVQRAGLGQDGAFSSIDIVDAATNASINSTGKTFNSLHQANFNEDVTIASGTTKSLIIAANMVAVATLAASYAGEAPALSLVSVTLKGNATLNAILPITGNVQTINGTISIGTATVQRGAYSNATSSLQVGTKDYTFASFQIQPSSVEKVEFKQIKMYQEGTASLTNDLTNIRLMRDATKIADGVVSSDAKYVDFSFTAITLDKGETAQFQVKADISSGSARTVDLGIYRTTDILVRGLTYGYNITPTYSGTGSSTNNPVLSDNTFTVSNGSLLVTKTNDVPATNIAIGNDQYLGSYQFEAIGEPITISALTLTITSSTNNSRGTSNITSFELVDPSGSTVAGPTDPAVATPKTVSWADSFTVPVGKTVYKVRADIPSSSGWATNNTIYVSFTPSAMTCRGDNTGNTITASPASALNSNTQTVRAGSLVVTRNSMPADSSIIIGGTNPITLSSWIFDASASGENVRITTIVFAAVGQACTNTNALTIYVDGAAKTPVNPALTAAGNSTFAFTEPIVIAKGGKATVELKGNKNSVASDATENWGLQSATDSVLAYGVSTNQAVTEDLTTNAGPTLTSRAKGMVTIETESNPTNAIVLANSTGNILTNVKFTPMYEDVKLTRMTVYMTSTSTGSIVYAFGQESVAAGDIKTIYVKNGSDTIASFPPSATSYSFDIASDKIPTFTKNISSIITITADMPTIDPNSDNAPSTANIAFKVGLGGANGIKTVGVESNTEVSGSGYEVYLDSTSSYFVLKNAKPTVQVASNSAPLGAATSLTNGTVPIFAFKVTAGSSVGSEVLLYRTTFIITTSGDVTVNSLVLKNENGDTVSATSGTLTEAANGYDGSFATFMWSTTFNNPDFDVTGATSYEALKVPAGSSKTYILYATVGNASAGENLSTFLVGDTASTSHEVGTTNKAQVTIGGAVGFAVPGTTPANLVGGSLGGNFVWSDNYQKKSITGIDGTNVTSTAMWYNGHLVPGLLNAVTTTPYTIGF